MGSGAPGSQAQGYRPPWYWLPVLGVAALIATGIVINNARSRIDQNKTQFRSAQQVRLHEIETRIDDYFGKAIQLVNTGAQTLADIHDPATAETLVNELFRSRSSPQIYDVGVAYAAYAFDPKVAYFCVFDWAGPHGEAMQGLRNPRSRPYTAEGWYQRAMETPTQPRFDGPYDSNGKSYISTVLAIHRGGRVVGVMDVDVLAKTFIDENMSALLAPGDIGWIESSSRGKRLLETSPFPPRADLIDEPIQLRYTGAFIHLSSDAAALHAANARVVTGSVIIAVAIWLITGLLAGALIQVWRSRQKAASFEDERSRLESEVAVGKRVEAELRKAAFTDALTGLPNRAAFLESAAEAITRTATGARYAVFFIDLDRFNMINETMGHLAGDELLKIIAVQLREVLGSRGMVARLGGDEFVMLALIDPSRATTLAEGVLTALHEPKLLGGRLVYTGASIGVVVVDDKYERPEELLRDADIAMYEAKHRGRACFALFDTAMRGRVAAESDLENDLRRAIERHEFVPYYQPIFDAKSETIVSFEALVRWKRPGSGVVGAAQFIAYAERTGLIDAIDSSVLEDVCRDAAAIFTTFPNASVAANVSAAHLAVPNLADSVSAMLRTHGCSPQKLKLEITETAIMRNADQARLTLEALRRTGIQIVLDDFGAGQSSLGYLHRLPISGLKIDRSFVAPLPTDKSAVAIVRSVVALAQALGIYTVAEGVETAEQLELLREFGVDHAQGFFFSPAVALEDVLGGVQRTTA